MRGQQVAVIQISVPGRYRLTRWAAPKLACEAVYYTSEAMQADGAVAYMAVEARPARLDLAEPDASLFDTDAFSELPPSEGARRVLLALGNRLSSRERARIEKEGQELDRKYFGH